MGGFIRKIFGGGKSASASAPAPAPAPPPLPSPPPKPPAPVVMPAIPDTGDTKVSAHEERREAARRRSVRKPLGRLSSILASSPKTTTEPLG